MKLFRLFSYACCSTAVCVNIRVFKTTRLFKIYTCHSQVGLVCIFSKNKHKLKGFNIINNKISERVLQLVMYNPCIRDSNDNIAVVRTHRHTYT